MKRLILVLAASTLATTAAMGQVATTGTGGGATDPNWTVSWTELLGGSATGSSAAFIPTSIPSAPWQPNTGSILGPNWIAAWASASAPGYRTSDNAANYEYAFATSVASSGSYALNLGWDNQLVGIYQNNVLLFGPESNSSFCRDGDGLFPSSQFPNCLDSITVNLASTDPLIIKLLGDGTTDGLFFDAEKVGRPQDVTPEPATMTLIATGLVGIMGAGMKKRRRNSAA